jgi:hypothetical protein
VQELSEQLRLQENMIERMKRAEATALERVNDLQNHLNDESSQRVSLENSLRDMDYRQKRLREQLKDEYEGKASEYEVQITLLKDELSALIAAQQGKGTKRDMSKNSGNEQKSPKKESEEQRRGDVRKMKQATAGYSTGACVISFLLPRSSSLAESDSFAVSERSHQTLLQKDEKIDHLSRQLQQAEVSSSSLSLPLLSSCLRIVDFP